MSLLKSFDYPHTLSEQQKPTVDINLYDLFSSSNTVTIKNAPILASALNICYRNALHSLHKNIDEQPSLLLPPVPTVPVRPSDLNVTEDDFDTSAFLSRSYTPSSTTISQWRHEAFLTDKFLRLLSRLVGEDMHSIVLHWTELELTHEEERQNKDTQKRDELRKKVYELKEMDGSIKIGRLYELSENARDILIEQVEWKSIGTKMRSQGGFKYFDEHCLKRMWIHRCQFGLKNLWTHQEDQLLDRLVEQLGYGQWTTIAEEEIFQKNKKSAYMCAQRYMSRANKTYSDRPLTQVEKERLLSIYKQRCSTSKDYRFSVSNAAYQLGDRSIRKITHAWTYISPDVQRGPFTDEEDQLLLRQTEGHTLIPWSILTASHFPNRSAVQCRQRYYQLIRQPKATKRKTREHKNDNASTSSPADTSNDSPVV